MCSGSRSAKQLAELLCRVGRIFGKCLKLRNRSQARQLGREISGCLAESQPPAFGSPPPALKRIDEPYYAAQVVQIVRTLDAIMSILKSKEVV